MRNRHLPAIILVVFFCLFLALPSGLAQPRGHGRGHGKAVLKQRTQQNTRVVVDLGARRQRTRQRVIVIRLPDDHRFARTQRPPGWDHGRKVGWGNCDVPPGLAKKVGCRDRIVVRRIYRPQRSRSVIVRVPFVGTVRVPY